MASNEKQPSTHLTDEQERVFKASVTKRLNGKEPAEDPPASQLVVNELTTNPAFHERNKDGSMVKLIATELEPVDPGVDKNRPDVLRYQYKIKFHKQYYKGKIAYDKKNAKANARIALVEAFLRNLSRCKICSRTREESLIWNLRQLLPGNICICNVDSLKEAFRNENIKLDKPLWETAPGLFGKSETVIGNKPKVVAQPRNKNSARRVNENARKVDDGDWGPENTQDHVASIWKPIKSNKRGKQMSKRKGLAPGLTTINLLVVLSLLGGVFGGFLNCNDFRDRLSEQKAALATCQGRLESNVKRISELNDAIDKDIDYTRTKCQNDIKDIKRAKEDVLQAKELAESKLNDQLGLKQRESDFLHATINDLVRHISPVDADLLRISIQENTGRNIKNVRSTPTTVQVKLYNMTVGCIISSCVAGIATLLDFVLLYRNLKYRQKFFPGPLKEKEKDTANFEESNALVRSNMTEFGRKLPQSYNIINTPPVVINARRGADYNPRFKDFASIEEMSDVEPSAPT